MRDEWREPRKGRLKACRVDALEIRKVVDNAGQRATMASWTSGRKAGVARGVELSVPEILLILYPQPALRRSVVRRGRAGAWRPSVTYP